VLEGHTDDVYALEFNAAGNRLLSAGYSGSLFVWDLSAGTPLHTTDLPTVVYGACYSPDSARIAAAASDGNVWLVDVPEAAR
jgi:WD40 repeat protein